jgi:Rad3-related DNA helicase
MMMDRVVEAVDRILDKHRGENGIIHTVSYSNAKTLLEKCINSGRMKIPKDANDGMNILKKGNGAVLASPAMEEGYDLKGDLSRFQIIIKVPFGFLGDPLIKYQLSKWPHMYERDVVMRIVQGSGRSVRSETDYAVTYILDGMFGSLFRESREYFPDWYAEAVRKTDLEFVLAE